MIIKRAVAGPFGLAGRETGVGVHLLPGDLSDVVDGLSEADAAELMDQHASTIAMYMIAAGLQAVMQILQQQKGAS